MFRFPALSRERLGKRGEQLTFESYRLYSDVISEDVEYTSIFTSFGLIVDVGRQEGSVLQLSLEQRSLRRSPGFLLAAQAAPPPFFIYRHRIMIIYDY